YNGIEYEEALELDMYEMNMRQYDPTVARWVAIDPVIHHSLSPYNAFDNNPVFWADPSGADGVNQWLQDLDGNWHHVDGRNFTELYNYKNDSGHISNEGFGEGNGVVNTGN